MFIDGFVFADILNLGCMFFFTQKGFVFSRDVFVNFLVFYFCVVVVVFLLPDTKGDGSLSFEKKRHAFLPQACP